MVSALGPTDTAPPSSWPPVWRSDSISAVQPGVTTARLSIAVFDSQEQFWRLISELTSQGICASQFSLWGLPDNIGKLDIPPTLTHQSRYDMDAMLSNGGKLIVSGKSSDLVFRCGELFESLLRRSKAQNPLWMNAVLRSKLAGQANNGGLVLLVSASTARQHELAARLLLKHGSHDLHTHEFSWHD